MHKTQFSILVAAGASLIGVASPAKAQTPSEQPAGLPDFADIVERVKPAVTGVNVRIEDKTTGRQPRRSPGQQDQPVRLTG